MFNDTVAANVALGAEVDEARVWASLEAANLADHVRLMPQGIHTEVGHNAMELLGGQRQRLAIARALLQGRACADLGRGDFRTRHRIRALGGSKHRRPDAGPHHPGDRPPPVAPSSTPTVWW